jgi:hypothetical protein
VGDYIIFIVLAAAGVALYLLDEPVSLLPRRVGYAVLALILIGLAIYFLLREWARLNQTGHDPAFGLPSA